MNQTFSDVKPATKFQAFINMKSQYINMRSHELADLIKR